MIMHLSTKGQVTIPQEIRTQVGIGPGSGVEVLVRDNEIIMRPAGGVRSPGQRAIERLRAARTGFKMTTEEIMAMTRGWDDAEG